MPGARIADAAALAVVYAAYRRFGAKRFRMDPRGPNGTALRHARDRGWAWFPTPDTCALTVDGLRALEPYGVREHAE